MILNKKYDVSFAKETVEKVENAAKELGYVPPKRKTRKGTKREKLLVVFCPNLTNPYYVMLLQGIEAHAKEKGFGLFVCNTQRDLRMEERYLKMMWQLRPLGIIYTCNPSHCFMDLVGEIAEQIPVAIVNNQNEKMNVDAVELDNSKLGRVMAKHLLELGHRKVAYIAPPLTARQKQRSKRVEGFLKEYEKAGLRDQVIIKAAKEEIDLDVAHIDSEYKIGYELTKELLNETTDVFMPHPQGHSHAIDLVRQIAAMNRGEFVDGEVEECHHSKFSIGVAGYPEKHVDALDAESDLRHLKAKVDAGADYVMTQICYDADRILAFISRCREAGIDVPVIPGVKPLSTLRQLTLLPETFAIELPEALRSEVRTHADRPEAIRRIGVEWAVDQCRRLKAAGVPVIHFYTMGRAENVRQIIKEVF